MGIVARQSLFTSVFSYIGVGLGFLNLIILFPRIMSPEEFGLTRFLLSFATLASNLSLLGSPQVLIKYSPFYRKGRSNQGLLFFSFAIASAGLLAVSLFIFGFSDFFIGKEADNELIAQNFLLVLPLIFGMVYFQIFADYLRANFLAIFPVFVQEVLQRVLVTILLVLVRFNYLNFNQFILVFSGIFLGLYLITLLYALAKIGIDLRPVNFESGFVKTALTFGFFTLLTGLSNSLVLNIDQLMVTYLSTNGLADTAVYSVAIYMAVVVGIPFRNINAVVGPLISKAFKENDADKINELYQKTSSTQFAIAGFLFILLWLNLELIFSLLPEQYAAGKWVLIWVGLAKVFDASTGCNGSIINFSKYFRYVTWFLVSLAVLTVITNLIFIPILGLTGAGVATAFSLFVYNLLKWLFIKQKFGFQPFTRNTFRLFLIFAVLAAVGLSLPDFRNVWLNSIFRSLFLTLMFVGILWRTNISPEITSQIKRVFKVKI
jgi:O-antigen/teichoic acid export membrane protein